MATSTTITLSSWRKFSLINDYQDLRRTDDDEKEDVSEADVTVCITLVNFWSSALNTEEKYLTRLVLLNAFLTN